MVNVSLKLKIFRDVSAKIAQLFPGRDIEKYIALYIRIHKR